MKGHQHCNGCGTILIGAGDGNQVSVKCHNCGYETRKIEYAKVGGRKVVRRVAYGGHYYIVVEKPAKLVNKVCLCCGCDVVTRHHIKKGLTVPLCPTCHVKLNKGYISIVRYTLEGWNKEVARVCDYLGMDDGQSEYPIKKG